MVHYELMSIWRVKKSTGDADFDAPLPEHGDEDRVDSSSATLGSPMKIVKYILKEDLKDYKLVKKTKRARNP